MRGLKFSLIIGTCLAASGCSSIWSGVGDFADFMSEKTEFLSLRKSKSSSEHVTNTVPNDQGLVQSSAGYYTPMDGQSNAHSYAHATASSPYTTTTASYTNNAVVNCPDGSYLTAENTCMIQETSGYQMTALRGYSDYSNSVQSSSAFSSGVTECPSGTYLTAENTCMQSSTAAFSPMIDATLSQNYSMEHLAQSHSAPLICPDGMVLVGAYDCRFPDSDSLMMSAPLEWTSAVSYGYEISCPLGSYKDPDNVCMRDLIMP